MKETKIEDTHKNICKFLVYVLRHKPSDAKLKLDSDGYADLSKVLDSIFYRFKIKLTNSELGDIIKKYSYNMFFITENKIKAKSGHSIILNMNIPDGFILTEKVPRKLFVLIDRKDIWDIKNRGIQSSYFKSNIVSDKSVLEVLETYIILSIDSEKAIKNNVLFYFNENIFYCRFIPAQFLTAEIL